MLPYRKKWPPQGTTTDHYCFSNITTIHAKHCRTFVVPRGGHFFRKGSTPLTRPNKCRRSPSTCNSTSRKRCCGPSAPRLRVRRSRRSTRTSRPRPPQWSFRSRSRASSGNDCSSRPLLRPGSAWRPLLRAARRRPRPRPCNGGTTRFFGTPVVPGTPADFSGRPWRPAAAESESSRPRPWSSLGTWTVSLERSSGSRPRSSRRGRDSSPADRGVRPPRPTKSNTKTAAKRSKVRPTKSCCRRNNRDKSWTNYRFWIRNGNFRSVTNENSRLLLLLLYPFKPVNVLGKRIIFTRV